MKVFSIFVISESGSLQAYYDRGTPSSEVEQTFDFPLKLQFSKVEGRLSVDFGSTDVIKIGYCILKVNGVEANGLKLLDGRDIIELLASPTNFPVTLRLGNPRVRPNDRITVASMFQAIHQMSRVLTPSPINPGPEIVKSGMHLKPPSGIQTLETPKFRLHCYESITGTKFLIVTDHGIPVSAREKLKSVYQVYTDYVLKNPFFTTNQPFNFDFFTVRLEQLCEGLERDF